MFTENPCMTLLVSLSDMGWSVALEDFILPSTQHDTCVFSVSLLKMLSPLGRWSMPIQEAAIANNVYINKKLHSKSWILGSVNTIEDNNQSGWQIFFVLKLKIGSLQVLEQGPRLLDNLKKNPFSWRILSENKTLHFIGLVTVTFG